MECCLISLKMVTFPSPKPFPKTLTQQLDVFWVHNNGESVGPLSRKFWPFYGLVSKWTWGLNKPLVYGHYKRGNDSLDLGVWGSNFRESPQEIITNLHNIIYIYICFTFFVESHGFTPVHPLRMPLRRTAMALRMVPLRRSPPWDLTQGLVCGILRDGCSG